MNDEQLQKDVLAELQWEPSVTAAHLGVAANAGVVTLSGHVQSYSEKYAAEIATLRVKGVKAVAEEIVVKLPIDTTRTDEEIALAAVDRLEWDVSIPTNSTQVKVQDGCVTLSGQVEWKFQKEAAEEDVRRLIGVTGVSNQIAIRARPDAGRISEDITHALHRSWFFDPKTIKVTAEGGRVHLEGNVASLHERVLAVQTAWGAPGTTFVENDLTVV